MNESAEIQNLLKILLKAKSHPIQEGSANVSVNQGVYVIFNSENEVLHVGRTNRAKKGLTQSQYNHLHNSS